ncbi:hypothetical protein DH2020_041731 [Rehmannia glutinosa]|uniref:Cytochrome b561 domain-containing protein n=1 Tax=Rehmannia glutinosa TaxID=99300 RepID=A0ABR0UQB6_REHGL
MNFPSVILFCIILCTPSFSAQTSSCNFTRKSLHQEIHHRNQQKQQQQPDHNTSLENHEIGGPRPWRNTHMSHNHRGLRTVHGTVNIIGWGVLLPIGIIIARYFRKQSNDWYSLHILSQVSGFLLGTFGWGLGISFKNAAKQHTMSTHGILGTLIFALAILQLLAMCLQPDEVHVCRKYWVIYHQIVGYALIVLIIANIFEGINNQSAAKRWEWFYGVILGVLGMSALALEVLRWNFN